MTDVSTTWAEVIFRVKWIVFVRRWCYKAGPLKTIGQLSHDGIGWKTRGTSRNVTNDSSFQNYTHPEDQTIRTTSTPGFKPFTIDSGAPAARGGAPYSYRKEKETHELIFSWLSRPAAFLVGAYARRRRRRRQVSKTADWLRVFLRSACAQRLPLTYCGDWKRTEAFKEREIERPRAAIEWYLELLSAFCSASMLVYLQFH